MNDDNEQLSVSQMERISRTIEQIVKSDDVARQVNNMISAADSLEEECDTLVFLDSFNTTMNTYKEFMDAYNEFGAIEFGESLAAQIPDRTETHTPEITPVFQGKVEATRLWFNIALTAYEN